MTPIAIQNLVKRFGQTTAVDQVSLDIAAGDLFFLLGPSGCGKTTLLRMIAGFTDPTAGKILFGEKDVTHAPPNARDTGMVFQGYALWPHMTVAQNVGFGLTVGDRKKKFSAEERQAKVDAALTMVQIEHLAERKINQLSGGQQQRVALARAMVIEPTVLLLDEPLSNLDAKLRLEMRSEIRRVCKQAGTTAIYVTHDQKEALSMADGVAVLKDGELKQVGPPRLLYERPANRFVADFLGETNFLPAEVVGREGDAAVLETPIGKLMSTAYPADLPNTGNVTCSIRPECFKVAHLNGQAPSHNHFTAQRSDTVYLGEMAQHRLSVADRLEIKAFELNPRLLDDPDPQTAVTVDPRDVVILTD